MANVNDTNNTLGKLENQWKMLREDDIDDRDRNAIEKFVRVHRKGLNDHPPSTLYADLSTLRNASDRADTPLIDMNLGDVRQLFEKLITPEDQGGYGVNPQSGIGGYSRALRVFFRWLDNHPNYDGYGFWDDIESPSKRVKRVSEDQILSEDDVRDLKEAALNSRDKALIEFLADTGARISMASQLRVGDIYDLDTDRPYYKPNPEAINHKGAPNKRYPVLYSQAELRTYLNQHHFDPQPEAPLWHVLRGYDRTNPEQGALSGARIRDLLRECKERAGIDKPVNPHNFRHTAITRLSKTGHTPKEIQHVAGWADDRMLEAYDHTTDVERNEQLRARAGFIDEIDAGTTPPTPQMCGNCREKLNPETRFCPNCGAATTEKARTALKDQDNRIVESTANADPDLAADILEFRSLLNERPALRAALLRT